MGRPEKPRIALARNIDRLCVGEIERGCKWTDLAREFGINRTTLYKMRYLDVLPDAVDTLIRIADRYDLSLDELVGRSAPGQQEGAGPEAPPAEPSGNSHAPAAAVQAGQPVAAPPNMLAHPDGLGATCRACGRMARYSADAPPFHVQAALARFHARHRDCRPTAVATTDPGDHR